MSQYGGTGASRFRRSPNRNVDGTLGDVGQGTSSGQFVPAVADPAFESAERAIQQGLLVTDTALNIAAREMQREMQAAEQVAREANRQAAIDEQAARDREQTIRGQADMFAQAAVASDSARMRENQIAAPDFSTPQSAQAWLSGRVEEAMAALGDSIPEPQREIYREALSRRFAGEGLTVASRVRAEQFEQQRQVQAESLSNALATAADTDQRRKVVDEARAALGDRAVAPMIFSAMRMAANQGNVELVQSLTELLPADDRGNRMGAAQASAFAQESAEVAEAMKIRAESNRLRTQSLRRQQSMQNISRALINASPDGVPDLGAMAAIRDMAQNMVESGDLEADDGLRVTENINAIFRQARARETDALSAQQEQAVRDQVSQSAMIALTTGDHTQVRDAQATLADGRTINVDAERTLRDTFENSVSRLMGDAQIDPGQRNAAIADLSRNMGSLPSRWEKDFANAATQATATLATGEAVTDEQRQRITRMVMDNAQRYAAIATRSNGLAATVKQGMFYQFVLENVNAGMGEQEAVLNAVETVKQSRGGSLSTGEVLDLYNRVVNDRGSSNYNAQPIMDAIRAAAARSIGTPEDVRKHIEKTMPALVHKVFDTPTFIGVPIESWSRMKPGEMLESVIREMVTPEIARKNIINGQPLRPEDVAVQYESPDFGRTHILRFRDRRSNIALDSVNGLQPILLDDVKRMLRDSNRRKVLADFERRRLAANQLPAAGPRSRYVGQIRE